MTKEEFAAQLNGREYGNEISKDEIKAAKDNELIVVFGASDDLMEFRGAVDEELGAWDGTKAYLIYKKDSWEAVGQETLDEYMDTLDELGLRSHLKAHEITALWAPVVDGVEYSWEMVTDLPYAHFDIMEDEEFYCRGIVIDTKDL